MDKIHEPSQFKARITDWPMNERPREKLRKSGPDAVSNAELIAILLGFGSAKYNAVDLAKKLLRTFGSLESLSRATLSEIEQTDGIGPAKSVKLLAAFQLYRNLQREKAERRVENFRNPEQVAEVYRPVLGHLKHESFYVILLDTSLKRIMDLEITRGIMDASLVHPREIFHLAVKNLAKGIIVLHNHPSGALHPSEHDISVTKRLVESGKILEIPVYDHLIITADGFYSFKEHGLIE
ncbi:MAG: DNA repair protein RadC [Caldithrix sp.]|nr:DNA repair protein RadC [Caldithrix sp.]